MHAVAQNETAPAASAAEGSASASLAQVAAAEAAQRVADECRAMYRDVRILEDGSIVAVQDLIYTRAILMDVDQWGWGRRFCFSDRALADEQFQRLRTADDEPSGAIARRGERPQRRAG